MNVVEVLKKIFLFGVTLSLAASGHLRAQSSSCPDCVECPRKLTLSAASLEARNSGGAQGGTINRIDIEAYDDCSGATLHVEDQIAGMPFFCPVKVIARDTAGNVIPTYTGPIDIRIGGDASLCTNALLTTKSISSTRSSIGVVRETIQPVDSGMACFRRLCIEKAGRGYYLKTSDPSAVLQSATSNSFNVNPAAPAKLAFYTQPPSVTVACRTLSAMRATCPSGFVLENSGTSLVVQIQDRYGNHNTDFDATVILSIDTFTPHVAGSPSSSGTIAVATSSNGEVRFTNLRFLRAGRYVLRAAGGGYNDALSAAFDVQPAAMAALAFSELPATAACAQALSPGVAVTAYDAYGNQVATTTTISLTVDGSILLSGDTSLPTSTIGTALFHNLVMRGAAGNYRLTASQPGGVTTSAMIRLLAGRADVTQSTIEALSTANAEVGGHTLKFKVRKRDACGNVTTRSSLELKLTDSGSGGAGIDISSIAPGQSSAVLSYTSGTRAGLSVAGLNATLAGSDIAGSPITLDQFAATAASLRSTLTGSSAGVQVGSKRLTFELDKLDMYGNATTRGFLDLILVDRGSGGARITSTTPGVRTFVPGSFLTAEDGLQSAAITYVSGTSAGAAVAEITAEIGPLNNILGSPIVIDQFAGPAVATHSGIQGSSAVIAISAGTNLLFFSALMRDRFNNPTTSGSIDISLTDNGAGTSASLTTENNHDGSYTLTYASGENTGVAIASISAAMAGIDIEGSPLAIDQISGPTAVHVKIALQGALKGNGSGAIMETGLNSVGLLPLTDPYGASVTLATMPAAIVDWVRLELRRATNGAAIAVTSALLHSDGRIVGTDGSSQLLFAAADLSPARYYIVIRHRNHLAIMSAERASISPAASSLYDFTAAQSRAYRSYHDAMVEDGVFALYSGDADISAGQQGIINASDRVKVRNASGTTGYLQEDISLDGIVTAPDRVLVRNNSFRGTQVP